MAAMVRTNIRIVGCLNPRSMLAALRASTCEPRCPERTAARQRRKRLAGASRLLPVEPGSLQYGLPTPRVGELSTSIRADRLALEDCVGDSTSNRPYPDPSHLAASSGCWRPRE